MAFEPYQEWLQKEWSLSISLMGAHQDLTHDPQRKSIPPSHKVGLEEAIKMGEIQADHSTVSFIEAMRKNRKLFSGKSSWEIGCGTGLASIEAGVLGASRVCASDIDEEAIQLVIKNGKAHNLKMETSCSDLFSGVPWKGPFDNLLSILPQKPCRAGGLPLANDGGPDGTKFLLPVIDQARNWLSPSGKLFLFLHSLAHPRAILQLYDQYEVDILSIKNRIFALDEYPGISKEWIHRKVEKTSYFEPCPDGRFQFICLIVRARPKR
jgi:SAM-dependent methyltransferase